MSSSGTASSGPRLEEEPRDFAKRYYTRMRSEAKAACEFVTLLQRTSRRRYEKQEYARLAINEEISIQGNKCETWVLYYKRSSRLLDIYNGPEVEVKRYCDDIQGSLRELNVLLRSDETYDPDGLIDRLATLEEIFRNCLSIAERELENLGIQVQ